MEQLRRLLAGWGLAGSGPTGGPTEGLAGLGRRRLLSMAAVAALLLAALATVALGGGSGDDDLAFLYTDLEPAAAQAVTAKLAAQNVPFQLSADGSSVLAPRARLSELRMALAGERLGGPIGYEVLDGEEPFGMSASRARLNETRAIEGELARSIESLEQVTRARVHLVMPVRELFAPEARKASASITVGTIGRLPAAQVQAIRYLVASAVPELSPEAVSVVDQTGALLARAGEGGEAGGTADERQAAVEAKLRDEIEALLEPIVGHGRVRARVSAEIDRDATREEANVFDPDSQVIARQVTVESDDKNSEADAAAEAATVAAELPENAGQPPAGGGDTRNSARRETSEDTTYQTSSKRSLIVRAPGRVTRLTVAVLVDGGKAGLPAPQIERLRRLVENAVGSNAERGDSVVVESMSFRRDDDPQLAEPGFFAGISTAPLLELAKLLLIGVVGLVALRTIRPRAAPAPPGLAMFEDGAAPALLDGERAPAGGAPLELSGLQPREAALLDQEIALAQVDGRIKASTMKRIGETIAGSPPEAAAVIRQWMNG